MKLLAIRRDAIFSPNSIEKDRIILQQVMDGLGTSVRMIDETLFSAAEDADVYVSMARHKRTLELLKAKEDNGALVINSAYGVERCERSLLDVALREQGIPVPNSEGSDGYWLKRGDMSAQHKGDVVYCKDRAELAEQQASFVLRGITNWRPLRRSREWKSMVVMQSLRPRELSISLISTTGRAFPAVGKRHLRPLLNVLRTK